MGELQELQKSYDHGNGPWHQFLKSIKITNVHGWNAQEIRFNFPIVAIVGENGIGKSTFLKAAACAYKNKSGKTFYPSKMFMSTQWDKAGLEGALIEYKVKLGTTERDLKWRKSKDWGFTPKTNKPERNVFFLDISRTLPLDATAGYAKVAMTSNTEAGRETVLSNESMDQGLDASKGQLLTLNEMYDMYMHTKRGIKVSTRRNYLYTYNKFVRDRFGKKRIGKITFMDVQNFYN